MGPNNSELVRAPEREKPLDRQSEHNPLKTRVTPRWWSEYTPVSEAGDP